MIIALKYFFEEKGLHLAVLFQSHIIRGVLSVSAKNERENRAIYYKI